MNVGPFRVIHVITGLGDGGAEGALFRLCSTDKKSQHFVISLLDEGKYAKLMREADIDVYCLRMRERNMIVAAWRLFRLLRLLKPELVQTWMYHADLMGGLCARIMGIKVVWGIRHTNISDSAVKRSTRVIARMCAVLSGWIPHRIVCCAEAARRSHIRIGYKKEKMVVVPNGYDIKRFSRSQGSDVPLRRDWMVDSDEFVVGMVARFDPIKDHENLLRALRIVAIAGVRFKCVLIGRGIDSQNRELQKFINDADLAKHVLLLGQRPDVPALMAALDLHVLSSKDEAFPNVLAEAMACGVPCVSTNAGDASEIVGETGWIVPVEDAESLAAALIQAQAEWSREEKKWESRRIAARERIIRRYDLNRMIDGYYRAWA